MSEERVKFAVIGCGRIGKRHIEMIQQHPEAELTALVDEDDQKKLQYSDVPFFQSIEEAVENVAMDVINIATPNGLHAEHALKALSLGKHVVIEKPMALRLKEAERIVEKAAERGKHVFVIMQNRYSPVIRWLKEVVDSGALGKIFIVQGTCFWNRSEAYYQQSNWHGRKEMDGGTLFTQFSHFIDLLYWLFGDVKNIQSRFYNHNHQTCTEFEDSGMVSFDFENGAVGNFQFTTSVWDKNLESTVTIIAEKGTIKIGGQYMDEVQYCHIKEHDLPDIDRYNFNNAVSSNHYYVIDDVVQTIKNQNASSYNIHDAVKVVDIIERMYQSTN